MIPPQLLAAGAGIALLAGFAGGWTVRDWKADSAALKVAQAAEKEREAMQGRIDAQAGQFEAFRQSIEPQRAQDRTTIKEVYRNVEVPADCALRPDALGVLSAALQRANAATTGKSGEPMSAATGADPGD